MKRYMGLFIAVLPLLTLLSCITDKEPEIVSLMPGDACPAFSIVMDDGATVTSESLRGEVGMIVFFNTSCPDCRKELPVIQEVSDELKASGREVNLVCIAREEGKESIERFWRENEMDLPYSPQPDREIYNLFASSVIPRIYILSPDLIITAAWGDNPMPRAEELINQLTGGL